MNYRQVSITAVILLLFAVIGTAMVASTYEATRERIAANERATLLRKLSQLVPPDTYDNNFIDDAIDVIAPTVAGSPLRVYRARMNARPVALVMTATAADGYSGPIRLLVGINHDGTLKGVRVVAHRETPGLGDAIDEQRSDWIYQFKDHSLDDPPLPQWKVRKDGGNFDQLTGATITPRAVVKAVRETLLYFRDHRSALFAHTETPTTP